MAKCVCVCVCFWCDDVIHHKNQKEFLISTDWIVEKWKRMAKCMDENTSVKFSVDKYCVRLDQWCKMRNFAHAHTQMNGDARRHKIDQIFRQLNLCIKSIALGWARYFLILNTKNVRKYSKVFLCKVSRYCQWKMETAVQII